MIRHLARLVWNRKRTTLLVMAEIFISFLVLFAVLSLGVYSLGLYRQPTGIDWRNVWDVTIDMKTSTDDVLEDSAIETCRQLMLAAREFPEVEAVAGTAMAPYEFGAMVDVREYGGRYIETGVNEVTDGFRDVIGLELAEGRWFGPEDAGQAYDVAVVNRAFAQAVRPGQSAVGYVIEPDRPAPDQSAPGSAGRAIKIVGMVDAYREDGEFDGQANYAIFRKDVDRPAGRRDRSPRHLLVRVQPGTSPAFEEQLVRRLQAVAREWSFEVRPLEDMRATSLRFSLVPLAAVGIVAGFLLVMVAMGLLGVLWQAVTQRTQEIGLRRAKGASIGAIKRQILGEIMVIATVAVLAGAALAAQVLVFNPFPWIGTGVFATGLALAAAAIYLLTILCGWYPARLATRIEPAEALRYE
jgi:putative ABC transport system permease protein